MIGVAVIALLIVGVAVGLFVAGGRVDAPKSADTGAGESQTALEGRPASLRGANLRNALLSSADLRSADLRGADLTGANMEGADLRGANFAPLVDDP